jgi:ribosomal subunit interface protein
VEIGYKPPQESLAGRQTCSARRQLMIHWHLGNTKIMRLILDIIGLSARLPWREVIGERLSKLENLASIASAEVRLESERRSNPVFRVYARLEVPGPDFHAEACDRTWQAALLKVVGNLERQIRSRHTRRAERWKTNLQLGRMPGRGAGSTACRA